MRTMRREWLFFGLVGAFALVYLAQYPASFAIADECEILSLAYAIEHGTVHPDRAGLVTWNYSMEFEAGGHRVIKYSPFHAALLAPALGAGWQLAFLVTAAFYILGAFVVRSMLVGEGVASEWAILYFLLPGMLYYSGTLMAAVPAAVMGLSGVALLARRRPRVALGAAALGGAVLLHLWMAALAVPFAVMWWLECGGENRWRIAAALAAGAAPAIAMAAAYNYATVGSPVVTGYMITGEVFAFSGQHLPRFLPFYAISLAVFPIAGLSVLSPRWSRGWAAPAAAFAIVAGASMYNYRDGLTSNLPAMAGFIAGAVPAQRFLLPASVIACVPAARWLENRLGGAGFQWSARARVVALALFAAVFGAIATLHQGFLRANAIVQRAIASAVPEGAEIVGTGDVLKELAPVYRIVRFHAVDPGDESVAGAADAYLVWIGAPGTKPPPYWTDGRKTESVQARSWAWNRDLWIAWPRTGAARPRPSAQAQSASITRSICIPSEPLTSSTSPGRTRSRTSGAASALSRAAEVSTAPSPPGLRIARSAALI